MAHVTFIHDVANKPPRDVLLRSSIAALGDGDGPELDALGVSPTMAYGANFLYSEPAAAEAAHEKPRRRWTWSVPDLNAPSRVTAALELISRYQPPSGPMTIPAH